MCAYVFDREDEKRWILKAQKTPLEIFFPCAKQRKNEDDEEKKNPNGKLKRKRRERGKKLNPPMMLSAQLVCVMYLTEGFQCALTH